MDTSKLAHPKPRPAALERKDRRSARKSQDEAENQKVRARSAGQCELGHHHPSLCYECDQKERQALTPYDDGSGAQTYNYRRVGRGGYRSWW